MDCMIGERVILFLEKAGIFLMAFVIVAFATIALTQWSDPFKEFFFKTGKWEELVLLMAFVLGIGYVLRWLLRLVFRIEAGIKPRRRH